MDSPFQTSVRSSSKAGGSSASRPGKNPFQPHVASGSPIKSRMNWTRTATMQFLDVVGRDIEQFGRGPSGLDAHAWLRVQQEMFIRCNILIDKNQLKTRYRALKKEWQTWRMLTTDRSITGLGRDPLTGAITAPSHWWAAMIAKDKDAAKFRSKALDHEDLMERVFRDITHLAGHSWVPGMPPQESPINVEGSGDSDSSNQLYDSATHHDIPFDSPFCTPSAKKRVFEPAMEEHTGSATLKRRTTPIGSTIRSGSFDEVMKSLSQPEVLQLQRGQNTIKEAHDKLISLPIFAGKNNLQLRLWALDLLKESFKNVEIVCDLRDAEEMMAWLRREHTKETMFPRKDRLAPPFFPPDDDE